MKWLLKSSIWISFLTQARPSALRPQAKHWERQRNWALGNFQFSMPIDPRLKQSKVESEGGAALCIEDGEPAEVLLEDGERTAGRSTPGPLRP